LDDFAKLTAEIIELLRKSDVCLYEKGMDRYAATKMILVCQIVVARLIAGLPPVAHRELLDKAMHDLPIIFEAIEGSTPTLGEFAALH
jgi:hypothetical protein